MRFRWTKKELEEASDDKILRSLVVERQSTCTNIYSPLYKRLQSIYNKLDKKIQEDVIKEVKEVKNKR
jgi:flagellar hook-associated protein FlgK